MCKKLVYLTFFTLVLGLTQGQARGAYRAAYWDGNYEAVWSGGGEGTRDALEAEGYEILSAVALKTWMDARIADGAASVVVFCRDAVPDTVAESMSATCTLRQYLDAGGKIVWYGDIPFYYQAPIGGGRTTWGDAGAPAILGFDTAGAPRDTYDDVIFTAEGFEWGLTEKWQSRRPASASVAASENLTVLATDNAGNATAWVKHYVPGDYYHGFVRFRDASGQASVDDIMRVAEYGLGRATGRAVDPNPDDQATDMPRDVVLNWTPGIYATPINGHTVYFSESFDDVNAGIGGVTQSASSYAPPQRLDFNKTYYWRVDEVNGPPDYTVYEGMVWSFTTELFSYPIQNITATASSQFNANTGPENTINGSGLDANDLHSKQEADIWVSSMTGPQPTWIQYEFDRVYKLHQMWVWNHNTSIELVLGFGIKDATIEYSSDGANWITLGTTHEFARAPGTPGYAHNTTVDLGAVPAKYVKITANSNWGGVLPQYGLSEVRFFHIPVFAREPAPASGATDADVDGVLSWRAGREAASHNVYFSDSNQAVIDGTAPVTTVSQASYGPLTLDLGQTYYWRVDEVNEAETPTTWQGELWDFTTQQYLVVDDFEDYNDFEPDRIFDTWIDGWGVPANGSQVGSDVPPFAEQTIIHSGRQSMPLSYNNTAGATYSEAERTFSVPQNWTEHGVKTLSLWFAGAANNVAGQMYVKVNNSKVTYDGDAADIARPLWKQWNIDLASFGVNLQSVTKLSIGIDGSGASGTLFFDDIRLYPYDRQFITPTEPSQAGLIGHWKFDGDTQDSSGRGNHGRSGVTPPAFLAGAVGSNSMDFRGADYVVIDGVVDDITSTDITLSIWIKTTQTGEGEVFAANDSASDHPFMLGIQGGNPFVNDGADIRFPPAVNDNQWHMLTYVRSGNTGYIYVDGFERGTYSASFDLGSVTRWSIGQEWDNATASNFYYGAVDDARFYDYALSDTEVAWLTGRTTPFDKPF